MRQERAGYHWITIEAGQHRFLRSIFDAFRFSSLRVWIDAHIAADDFDRTHCGGLVTATGVFQERTVAIAWSDFRVMAACYGRDNSRRFAAFIQHLDRGSPAPVPLIYVVNSAGLSLMEGRQLFAEAFRLWPALLAYTERHPVLTCALGKCLGLAPILFGLGHYRVAVARQTQLNLTGPEVITRFFGAGADFSEHASAERFHACNDLVHELVPSVPAALARFKGLLARNGSDASAQPIGPDTGALLASFLDSTPQEVVPGWCERLRLFVGRRKGRPLGLFVNPVERSDNMITVRTLDKYAAGLDLFRALRLPIVSLLDSPGLDPRFAQSEANNFRKMLWVGEKIIHYPHGAMGVLTRRCFGGSATLGFPKVFGGLRTVALRGCRVGTMHESLIEKQLRRSPRLLAQWQQSAARQGPGLADLLAQGTVDAVVNGDELPREVDLFLEQCDAPQVRVVGSIGRERSRARIATRDYPLVAFQGNAG